MPTPRRLAASLSALALALSPGAAADPLADEYARSVQPLVGKYCLECHQGKTAEADLDLSTFPTHADVKKAGKVWQKVGEMLDSRQMPPKTAAQLTAAEQKVLHTWVRSHLKAEAKAHAGDPGRVTLRRLSNAEYTYTLRDLTGVPSLDPAREFPIDGAAGEGFTNTGDALVMSPALLEKYLAAGKQVAAHAVLLPDGIRFSPSVTRRDRTNELLGEIRSLYAKYSDPSGVGSRVALQGLVWDGKEGGRLPVEKYVAATLEEREAIQSGKTTLAAVAADRKLSEKYLTAVWGMFTGVEPSPLLDGLRAKWKAAKPADAGAITGDIGGWQNAVWKFSPVGHIGKAGGPKAWLEPVDPLTDRQDIRFPVPPTDADEVTFYLITSGTGAAAGWERPRFVAPGKPDLLLRDVEALGKKRTVARAEAVKETAKYLAAADEAAGLKGKADVKELAKKHGLNADVLTGWFSVLGVGASGPVKVTGHLDAKLTKGGGYDFISGWGSNDTPLVLANSSDKLVRIPGDARGNGVVVHPSPTLNVAVGWQSPVSGTAKIAAKVQHAHVACGNGVTWAVEVRRGSTRERLAGGIAQGQKAPVIDPMDKVAVSEGDLISVVVGPRDGNHSCDLTAVDLTVTIDGKTWDLSKDVSPNITAGNPHSEVWHFYTEPTAGVVVEPLPKGSLVEKWRAATGEAKTKLAGDVQTWLAAPADKTSAEYAFHRRLSSLNGPLFGTITLEEGEKPVGGNTPFHRNGNWSTGGHGVTEVKLPADLVRGTEFVSRVVAGGPSGHGLQIRVSSTQPTDTNTFQPGAPILVGDDAARQRW